MLIKNGKETKYLYDIEYFYMGDKYKAKVIADNLQVACNLVQGNNYSEDLEIVKAEKHNGFEPKGQILMDKRI